MSTERPVNWPPFLRDLNEHDWPEDAKDDDNGCYQHVCKDCDATFIGAKRRLPYCKKCCAHATPTNAASETPRTDYQSAWLYRGKFNMQEIADSLETTARTLERELATLTAKLADEEERHSATLKLLNGHDAEFAKVMDERDAVKAKLAAMETLVARKDEALDKMQRDIPASDSQGGFYIAHFDGEGNEVGIEPIDPVALVGHLAARIGEALALTAHQPTASEQLKGRAT